jgi:hypothetical protein
MITIHKYEIPFDQPARVQLPGGARVVHTASTYPGTVTAWIMHDLDLPEETYRFRTVENGHPIEPNEVHVGSIPYGNRVVHLLLTVDW